MIPIFKKGNKTDLEFEHLCRCCADDETDKVSSNLRNKWNEELTKNADPSLMKAIIKAFWPKYSIAAATIFFSVSIKRHF